jgi:hypothetical protein
MCSGSLTESQSDSTVLLLIDIDQCSGSETESESDSTGSTILGLPDLDPLVRGMDWDPDPTPDPSIIKQK